MTRLDSRVFGITLLAVVGLASTAIAQTSPPQKTPQHQSSQADETQEQCPAFMRGSTLKVTNATGGVAVSITTPIRDYVEPLREVLREVADAVEQESRVHAVTANGEAMPPLEISTKNIKGGAQMVIRTKNPESVAELREQAKGLEDAWAQSACVGGGQATASR